MDNASYRVVLSPTAYTSGSTLGVNNVPVWSDSSCALTWSDSSYIANNSLTWSDSSCVSNNTLTWADFSCVFTANSPQFDEIYRIFGKNEAKIDDKRRVLQRSDEDFDTTEISKMLDGYAKC